MFSSRRQQHYHSQRRDNREPSHRPVSNFYEYESVQAVLRGQTMDTNCNSLPRRSEIAPTHGKYGNVFGLLFTLSNHEEELISKHITFLLSTSIFN